ncbi:MAG: tRNA lysidine(34) synthetase TilS [Chitinophagia bacterium]|jgi:tRNA(Ile)-lysidine synthase
MLALENFTKNWDKKFPALSIKNTHFLIAVSGGVDSMVLAHLMHANNAKITIAHVNFQLRGEESVRDENFIRDFAKKLNLPLQVHRVDTLKYAELYKMGIQEAAREIRYAWFESLLKKEDVLLTAHHADDQTETVLMQLFRGTGLHGLTGIPHRRNDVLNLARPLLSFTKEQIKWYAKEQGLSFVEDSSNTKDDYTRNLIRNKIIPQIQAVYPHVNENIFSTAEKLKEAEAIVEATVATFWKKGFKTKKGILTLPVGYWNKVKDNATYTWGLIQAFGFKPAQIMEVHKLLEASNGAYIATPTHRFIKFKEEIQIVPNDTPKEHLVIYVGEGTLQTKNGSLHFELLDVSKIAKVDPNPNIAYLDAAKLDWPILYRTWQSTDYFYPLGLAKKKKLNHFLGGLKLSPASKEQVAIISVGDKICWVVGHRMDDRFKMTTHTTKVLKITCQNKP